MPKVDGNYLRACGLAGDPEVIHLLLDKLDLGTVLRNDLEKALLLIAAGEGNLDVVKRLIKEGVDGSDLLASGDMLFQFDVSERTIGIVEYLTETGIFKPHRQDEDDWNLVHYAASADSSRLLEYARRQSTNFNTLTVCTESPLHIWGRYGKSIATLDSLLNSSLRSYMDAVDNEGYTPLHVAAKRRNSASLGLLLEHGADTTLKTKMGDTIYHLGIGDANIISIQHLQSRPDLPLNDQNTDGKTILHQASLESDENIVRHLLSLGADITIADKYR